VLGSIAYIVSKKPRGEGWIPQPDQIAIASPTSAPLSSSGA